MSEYAGPSEETVQGDAEVDRAVDIEVAQDVEAESVVEVESAIEDDPAAGEEDEVFVLEEAPDPDSVLPVWEPTGHPDVDAALEKLHEISGSDVADHAAVFEQVEASLRATLDGLTAEDEPA